MKKQRGYSRMFSASLEPPKARVIQSARSCRILIANAKGGSGKTTLATNTAAYLAKKDNCVALIDHDPQCSSSQWLQARSEQLPSIYSVAAHKKSGDLTTKSFQLKVPANTTHIIIDTPAGLSGNALSDLVKQADIIVIPVVPSAIDIRAATSFIKDVLLSRGFRCQPKPIAVIANRVKRNTLGYTKLSIFLNSLNIPFISSLRDTQHYVRAAEHGMGIFDFSQLHEKDLKEWQPYLSWLLYQVERMQKKN